MRAAGMKLSLVEVRAARGVDKWPGGRGDCGIYGVWGLQRDLRPMQRSCGWKLRGLTVTMFRGVDFIRQNGLSFIRSFLIRLPVLY